MEQLAGSVAVVTGGASGIGLALGKRFAAEGMRVVLADVEPGALERAVADLSATGAAVLGVRTDVSEPDALVRLRDAALERFGKVNVLCNNAGVQRSAPTWKLTDREWRWLVDVNLLGVVSGIRAFVPRMLEQGDPCHIVNTASLGGLVSAPLMSAYCGTKYAVVALSESLRGELGGTNVGVSVLCPAFVRTRLGDADRNMPASLEAGLSAEEIEERRNIGRGAAALVEGGISVDVVSDCVVDALRHGRFYVLTHPETIGAFKKRADGILRAASEAEEFLRSRGVAAG